MYVYYTAKLNTEAGKLAGDYFKKCKQNRKNLISLMKKHGFKVKNIWADSDGEAKAFSLKNKTEVPENWVRPKICPVGYFPKRIKSNMLLIKAISEIRLGGAISFCEAMFGKCPLFFDGLSIIRGIGGEVLQDRAVFGFCSEKYVEELKKLSWPKGLRRIKESTYYRFLENEKE